MKNVTNMTKQLVLHNWRSKIVSFLVAVAIWYLLGNHVRQIIERGIPQRPPVPGTIDTKPERTPEPPPAFPVPVVPTVPVPAS